MNDPIIVPPRKSLTQRQRVKLFDAHAGRCYLCDTKIMVGEPWIDEHVIPREISANDNLENRRPVHVRCAEEKTAKDQGDIAKVLRTRAKHIGARKPRRPFPGGKGSKWKRTMDGKVIPRE